MTREFFFLLNHLWQSTLVAGVAWLACRTLLKEHSPRVRFGVWLAASLKFLIPFAVFVDIGHWLGARPLLTPAQSQQVFDVIAAGSSGLAAAPFRVSPAPQAPTGSDGRPCWWRLQLFGRSEPAWFSSAGSEVGGRFAAQRATPYPPATFRACRF